MTLAISEKLVQSIINIAYIESILQVTIQVLNVILGIMWQERNLSS